MSDPAPHTPPSADRTGEWVADRVTDDRTAVLPGAGRSADLSDTGIGQDDEPRTMMRIPVGEATFPRAFGNYELLAEIARGGMGVVYRARQKSLGRVVALKTILPSQVASATAVQRFYQEAQAAAGLDHPGIVAIHEIGEHQGEHYFTMAFVEGTSLSSLVKNGGPLPPEEAARLVQGVAEAVHYANDRGILHRDLKPDNVLLDGQGRPRVTDFGLAKQLAASEQGLTVTGQIMGTPAYMSPEQALGGKRTIGPPSDLYALGGILYFLLSGKAPFQGDTITELLCKVATDRPVPLREFAPGVPPELEAVCMKCLEKSPADRFANCAELASALSRFSHKALATMHSLDFESKVSFTVNEMPAAPPKRKRPALLLAGVAAAVLLGVGGVAAYRLASRPAVATPDRRDAEVAPVVVADAEVEPAPGVGKPGAKEPDLPIRKDFGLEVDLVNVGAPVDGVYRIKDGDVLRVRVGVSKSAYVGVWTVDTGGNVMQLFPHEKEKNNFIRAGEARDVPGPDYEIVAEAGKGVERVHVVASTKQWDFAPGKNDGGFKAFRDDLGRQEWKRSLRALKVRPVNAGQLSEQVLKYRVAPAPKNAP